MDLHKSTVCDLRHMNRSRVLREIYKSGRISRIGLSQRTGLSPATVTNVVGDLLAEGVVLESGSQESHGGRPRALLAVNQHHGYFVGIDLGETRIEIELFDLSLQRVSAGGCPLSLEENQPQQVVSRTVGGLQALLDQADVLPRDIVGVGVGVPGLVEPAAGVSMFAPNWGWHDVPLMAMLREHLHVPIFLDNGAKAMALAEMWFGAGRGVDSLAVLLIGTGVGAGIIANGALYRGATNSAGEWGHTTVELDGRPCRCGSSGCLEAYVGAPGIIQRLREQSPESPLLQSEDQMAAIAAIVGAAKQGDAAAANVLKDTTHYLGAAVANLVNLFNPELIVLGGWVGLQFGGHILGELQKVVARYALTQPLSKTRVGLCQLGHDAVTVGAATLVLEEFLQAAGSRALLAGGSASGA